MISRLIAVGTMALTSGGALAQDQTPATSSIGSGYERTAPEIITRVPASYPPEAALEYRQGQVMVKFHVSENGDVESVEAVRNNSSDSDSPVLEEAALRAARQWKFKPYLVNGKPMKFTTTVPFVFRINEQVSDWGSNDPSAPVRAVEDKVLQGWVVHRVQPAYPEKAKKALIGGAVVMDAIIDRQGSIR